MIWVCVCERETESETGDRDSLKERENVRGRETIETRDKDKKSE